MSQIILEFFMTSSHTTDCLGFRLVSRKMNFSPYLEQQVSRIAAQRRIRRSTNDGDGPRGF
jgi:hypothetical protein